MKHAAPTLPVLHREVRGQRGSPGAVSQQEAHVLSGKRCGGGQNEDAVLSFSLTFHVKSIVKLGFTGIMPILKTRLH